MSESILKELRKERIELENKKRIQYEIKEEQKRIRELKNPLTNQLKTIREYVRKNIERNKKMEQNENKGIFKGQKLGPVAGQQTGNVRLDVDDKDEIKPVKGRLQKLDWNDY